MKKPQDVVHFEKVAIFRRDDCQPQAMWVWVGQKLMGQKTVKDVCVKSQIYEVAKCSETGVQIKDREGRLTFVLASKVCELLRLTDALTYQRAQGLTLSGLVVLLDTNSPNFELEHLNVGITRATHSSLVEIRDL